MPGRHERDTVHLPDSPVLYCYLPVLFFAGWVVVSNIIALLTGWRDLALAYRAQEPFSGERFRFRSGRMRMGMGYNNMLTVGTNMYGLYLAVFLPFRIGHPPLFIPWSDISAEPDKVLWVKMTKLTFAKCPTIPFIIPGNLAEKLSQASGLQLKIEDT